jgi:hypothetical protein
VQEVMAALGSKLEAAEQTSRYLPSKSRFRIYLLQTGSSSKKKFDKGILDPNPGSHVESIYVSLDPDSFPYSYLERGTESVSSNSCECRSRSWFFPLLLPFLFIKEIIQ